jgi:hypothetical protein
MAHSHREAAAPDGTTKEWRDLNTTTRSRTRVFRVVGELIRWMLHKESPQPDETIGRWGSPAKDRFVIRTQGGDGDQAIVTGGGGRSNCDKLRATPHSCGASL